MYKVGECVEVGPNWPTKNPPMANYGINKWKEYFNKKYTIMMITDNDAYVLKEDEHGYYWPEYMLKPSLGELKRILLDKGLL